MARNLNYARKFDPYAKGVSIEELQQVRRQLAKVMNQRMVRLENTKSPITGESYDFGAYDLMDDYLEKQGRNRFSEVLRPTKATADGKEPWSKADLQKEIKKLQRFEELKSSRIAGMHEIEAARVKTFTTADKEKGRKAGLATNTVKSKDFYDFLNSSTYEDLTKSFDSETIIEEFDRAYDRGVKKEDIVDALNKYMERSSRPSIKGIKRKLQATTVETKKKRGRSTNARSKNKKRTGRARRR